MSLIFGQTSKVRQTMSHSELSMRRKQKAERRGRLAAWVAREVLPHEASVRAWLLRAGLVREDVEDVIQESYCRLAELESVQHILRADSYFFQTARNLVIRRIQRSKIVPFVPMVREDYQDDQPDPERDAGGRMALSRVMALLERLPERRRKIFAMRRIDGMSQREIAAAMNVSENVVEHEIKLGLVDLKRAWAEASMSEAEALAALPIGRRA
jgi:RNA polymerase sigma-70 factor (ECF subfamily)